MSVDSTTICVTDGITKRFIIAHKNKIPDEALHALFQTNVVCLQCIDTNSNTEAFNICRIDGQYNVFPEKHYTYKIIKDYKESNSLTNIKQKLPEFNDKFDNIEEKLSEFNDKFDNIEEKLSELNDKFDLLNTTRSKSLTPTNNISSSEFDLLLSKVDTRLNEFTSNFDQKLSSFSNELNMLYELVQPMISRAIDPWDITARSQGSSTSSLSKQVIIKHYGLHENECMICGRCNNVVTAHIWPKHTHGENLLSMFRLSLEDLNDPRNYLRLSKPIELAFDNKTATIIDHNGALVLFVLDNVLKRQMVSNTKYTFNDCHLWPLKFGNRNRPFLRILAAHCRNSFIDAFRLKRIDNETYTLGYNSSIAMLNASPGGEKSKIFDWFAKNEEMIKNDKKS